MSGRAFWIMFAVGAALRLLLIWQAELWYDENFSLILARLPFTQMLQATMGDVHPPLYYILIWPLGQIRQLPPWALRIPSALFSICSLAIYPRLMRRLFVPAPVQIAAFGLLALLPMQIHYAQEARMYALLELLVILGALAILEWRPVLLAAAAAGLLYTQNYGTFYVAALGAVLMIFLVREWWQFRSERMADAFSKGPDHQAWAWDDIGGMFRRQGIYLVAALGIGIAAWLPWLPIMLRQAEFIEANYWIFDTSPGGIAYEIFKLFFGLSLSTAAGHAAGILLASWLMILAVWHLLIRRPRAWLMIAVLAFGPIIAALIVSLVYQPLFLYRPLLGVTPFLYLACAYPLGMIASMRGRLYAACFVAPVVVMAIIGYYRFTPEQKTTQGTGSMRQAVAYVQGHWQPGDVILHGSGLGWVVMAPYTDKPQFALPFHCASIPGGLSDDTSQLMGIPTSTLGDLPPHRRVWFTAVFSPMLPACQVAQTESVIAGRAPALVLSETKFLLSAIWLLEG